MENFWAQLNKPFYALAPMAGITDRAFRQRCKRYGADLMYTEMASAAALFYNDRKTRSLMEFDEGERPIVVQLFGAEPKHFEAAARFIGGRVKPDGIDINFGCPVAKVAKQGAGTALFQDLKKSREALRAVLGSTALPVSIKTRSRAGEVDVLKFLDNISDLDIKAIMIHGRSGAGGFSGPVDAAIIRRARDHFRGIIIANGGISGYDSAHRLLDQAKADGVGIGQGALGRPWIFKAVRTGQPVIRSPRAAGKEAIRHAELAYKYKGGAGIAEMRKHLCWYTAGLPGARRVRSELTRVESLADIRRILGGIDK